MLYNYTPCIPHTCTYCLVSTVVLHHHIKRTNLRIIGCNSNCKINRYSCVKTDGDNVVQYVFV